MKSDGRGVNRHYGVLYAMAHRTYEPDQGHGGQPKLNAPLWESVICRLPELMRVRAE